MASPYFDSYSRNLQRILMAEFVDNLRCEDRMKPERSFPSAQQKHVACDALRQAFAAMEPIPMPDRAAVQIR